MLDDLQSPCPRATCQLPGNGARRFEPVLEQRRPALVLVVGTSIPPPPAPWVAAKLAVERHAGGL
ncbi:MAG TPA: hypothetical protein VM617_07805 [Thermoanaerobaculia bacterium]|nr:hypothetical protein [Thermoanaerobaculia bacterium]